MTARTARIRDYKEKGGKLVRLGIDDRISVSADSADRFSQIRIANVMKMKMKIMPNLT